MKTILTSYEAEVTMTSSTAVNSGKLQTLEQTLQQYKQELHKLEQELNFYQAAPPLPGEAPPISSKDKAELEKLNAQVTQLKEDVSKLQEEKEVLEYRLEQRAMRGDYDPSQVNVLHMKQNPTSEAYDSFKDDKVKLEAEIAKLRDQLAAALTASSGSSLQPAVSISSEADKSKIQDLEVELKNMEVKHQRLIEAFKGKSKEFRELVYRLMGYQVKETDESNIYKLSSMYAESPDDFFLFELANDGTLNLLSTEFSNSLEDLIEAYLSQEESYPVFLSAVTIDLFNRQTMVSAGPSAGPSSSSGRRTVPPAAPHKSKDSDDEGDSDGERHNEEEPMADESDEGEEEEEPMIDSDSEGEVGPRVDIPGDEDDEDDEDEEDDDEDEEEEDDSGEAQQRPQDDGSDDDLICLD